MARRFQFSLVFALLIGIAVGCGGPSYTESLVSPDVRVRVIHPDNPGGSRGTNDGVRGIAKEVFYWDGPGAGEVEVVIDDSRLSVDGHGFGTVKPKDLVVIDAVNGKAVKVNAMKREPDAEN